MSFSLKKIYVLCVLALSFALSSLTQAEPVIPIPPPNGWIEFHERLVNDCKQRADKIKIVFAGDSITARWTWTNFGIEIWDQRYAPIGAINLGISADGTQHLRWRLQHGILDTLHPQAVVLLIGTNNLNNTPEEVAYGVWSIVADMRKAWPEARVLVQGIFPRVSNPQLDAQVPLVNDLLAKLADGKMVKYLNFGDRYLLSDGSLNKSIITDGVHPGTPEGFQIWSDAIQPIITEWLEKAPLANVPPPAPPVAEPQDKRTFTPDTRDDFLAKHKKNVAAAARGNCDLLFLGDALMTCWYRPPELFKKEYGAYRPLNFAIWESVLPENVLWQLENGELDGIQPRLVVVQMQDCLRDPRNPVENLAAGMGAIVRSIQKKSPESKVLLLGGFPVGEKAGDPARARVAGYNELLSKLADGKSVFFLDIGAKFLTPDGTLEPGAVPAINPTLAKPFEKWADTQRDLIQKIMRP